jgi:hypothetical protein
MRINSRVPTDLERVEAEPALRVGLIAIAMVLGANATAVGAEDCLTAPNRAPGPMGYWHFHFDRNQGRKCWHLVESAPVAPAAQAPLAPPPAAAQTSSPPLSLSSIFSYWITPVPLPPDTANASAPAVHPDHDAAALQPRTARRFGGQHAALTPKPRKPPPAAVAHAVDQGTSSPTEAKRDALFQEFLRWQGRQDQQ